MMPIENTFYYGDSDSGSQGYCSDAYQFSPESHISNKGPHIEIIDQPGDFRYRYEKEKYHGHILSIDSPSTKKKDLCKFPKIKVHNWHNDVVVRCWLISSKLDDKPTAHIHKLSRKVPKGEIQLEPHKFYATERNNYEVTFDYLYIVHAVMSDPNDIEIYEQKRAWLEIGSFERPELRKINPEAGLRDEAKKIDRNQSVLYFEAFDVQTREKICEAVSRKIKNLHNPETSALKIVNYSRTYGTCRGGDEVFMFVEKISKDVDVQFFEQNKNTGERTWQERADYGPQHIHHQYGIVFRTPRYHDVTLRKDVQIFIELHRKTDGAKSAPVKFTYKPDESCRTLDIHKKRPHSPERTMVIGTDQLLSESGMKKSRDESMFPDSTSIFSEPNNATIHIPEGGDILFGLEEWFSSIAEMVDPSMPVTQSAGNGNNSLNSYPDIPLLLGNLSSDGISSTKNKTALNKELPRVQCDFSPVKHYNDDISSLEVSSTVELFDESKSNHPDPQLSAMFQAIKTDNNFGNVKNVLSTLNAERINACDFEGNSILLIASRYSREALVALLTYEVINKNIKNLDGDNALLCAARNEKIDLVEILLKNKFNPNEQNYKTGETPLHLAVAAKNMDLVMLLLKYGANPLVDNFGSQSAYDYSCDCEKGEIKKVIYNKAQDILAKQRNWVQPSKCSVSEADLIKDLQTLKYYYKQGFDASAPLVVAATGNTMAIWYRHVINDPTKFDWSYTPLVRCLFESNTNLFTA